MRSWKETRRDGNELIWGSVKGSKTKPSTKTTHETGQLSREASYQNEAISRRDGHLHWLNRTTSHGGFHDPSTTTPPISNQRPTFLTLNLRGTSRRLRQAKKAEWMEGERENRMFRNGFSNIHMWASHLLTTTTRTECLIFPTRAERCDERGWDGKTK